MEYEKKLKIFDTTSWKHHRSGWKDVIKELSKLDSSDGRFFHSFLDGFFANNYVVEEPWTGFFHNPPVIPSCIGGKYVRKAICYMDMFERDNWKKSLPYCKGLFTLSPYLQKFLSNYLKIPVNFVYHPSSDCDNKFSINAFIENQNKKIVMIGHWLRRFDAVYELRTNKYNICILNAAKAGFTPQKKDYNRLALLFGNRHTRRVKFLKYKEDEEYDVMLSRNIVFMNLYDCCACNTIIDCMIRNTPIIINKLAGVVDYLGPNYPLYYSTIEEAGEKADNFKLIREAHSYLENHDVTKKLSFDYFLKSLVESPIYQSL